MSEVIYNQEQGCATILLDEPMMIQSATKTYALFTDAIEKYEKIFISQKNVDEFDLTYLQLLISLHKTAVESGKEIRFDGPHPESFIALINDSGFPLNIFEAKDNLLVIPGGNNNE
ncbi:MAG: STAS domain-containing protein [Melioribacteraceae bacterium]